MIDEWEVLDSSTQQRNAIVMLRCCEVMPTPKKKDLAIMWRILHSALCAIDRVPVPGTAICYQFCYLLPATCYFLLPIRKVEVGDMDINYCVPYRRYGVNSTRILKCPVQSGSKLTPLTPEVSIGNDCYPIATPRRKNMGTQ